MITIVSGATSTDLPAVLYRNLLAEGTLTATNTGAGAPANILGPQTFDYWQPSAAPSRAQVALTGAVAADCACIEAHNLGTKGATVQIQHSPDGATWTTVATLTPADDSPVMVLFASVARQYWAVNISAAPGGMPSLGIVYIGPRLVFPSPMGVPYTPLNLSQKIDVALGGSLGGQVLGITFKRRGKSGTVPFCPIDATWALANLPAFRAYYDTGAPFFFAACAVQYANDLTYCTRAANAPELRPTLIEAGLWCTLALQVDAYGA